MNRVTRASHEYFGLLFAAKPRWHEGWSHLQTGIDEPDKRSVVSALVVAALIVNFRAGICDMGSVKRDQGNDPPVTPGVSGSVLIWRESFHGTLRADLCLIDERNSGN